LNPTRKAKKENGIFFYWCCGEEHLKKESPCKKKKKEDNSSYKPQGQESTIQNIEKEEGALPQAP